MTGLTFNGFCVLGMAVRNLLLGGGREGSRVVHVTARCHQILRTSLESNYTVDSELDTQSSNRKATVQFADVNLRFR